MFCWNLLKSCRGWNMFTRFRGGIVQTEVRGRLWDRSFVWSHPLREADGRTHIRQCWKDNVSAST